MFSKSGWKDHAKDAVKEEATDPEAAYKHLREAASKLVGKYGDKLQFTSDRAEAFASMFRVLCKIWRKKERANARAIMQRLP